MQAHAIYVCLGLKLALHRSGLLFILPGSEEGAEKGFFFFLPAGEVGTCSPPPVPRQPRSPRPAEQWSQCSGRQICPLRRIESPRLGAAARPPTSALSSPQTPRGRGGERSRPRRLASPQPGPAPAARTWLRLTSPPPPPAPAPLTPAPPSPAGRARRRLAGYNTGPSGLGSEERGKRRTPAKPRPPPSPPLPSPPHNTPPPPHPRETGEKGLRGRDVPPSFPPCRRPLHGAQTKGREPTPGGGRSLCGAGTAPGKGGERGLVPPAPGAAEGGVEGGGSTYRPARLPCAARPSPHTFTPLSFGPSLRLRRCPRRPLGETSRGAGRSARAAEPAGGGGRVRPRRRRGASPRGVTIGTGQRVCLPVRAREAGPLPARRGGREGGLFTRRPDPAPSRSGWSMRRRAPPLNARQASPPTPPRGRRVVQSGPPGSLSPLTERGGACRCVTCPKPATGDQSAAGGVAPWGCPGRGGGSSQGSSGGAAGPARPRAVALRRRDPR